MLDLKARRIALGLTMLEVAKAIGVSEATISRYESGNIKNMRRDRIEKYAQILQVSPAAFIGINHTEQCTDSKEQLDDVYFSFAKNAQDEGIDPDDIMLAIETIKNMRRKNGQA